MRGLSRGANSRERLFSRRGSRRREGWRALSTARRVRRPPSRLPAAGPLPERKQVALLERCVDDLGHAVVVAITVTHALKVRPASDGTNGHSGRPAGRPRARVPLGRGGRLTATLRAPAAAPHAGHRAGRCSGARARRADRDRYSRACRRCSSLPPERAGRRPAYGRSLRCSRPSNGRRCHLGHPGLRARARTSAFPGAAPSTRAAARCLCRSRCIPGG